MEEATPQEIAIDRAIAILDGMTTQAANSNVDGEAMFDDDVAVTMALAWSNLAIAIVQSNRFAAARNLASLAADWLENPTREGHDLLVVAVSQYRDFG